MAKRKRHQQKRQLSEVEKLYKQTAENAMAKNGVTDRTVKQYVNNQVAIHETAQVVVRATPICWGIPTDEIMYSKFFTVLWKNGHIMPWDDFSITESTYLPDARNDIHESYVKDSDYPFLMMLDSDVMAPPHFVERLMAHKKPIVGGWYKNKNRLHEPHPIVYDYGHQDEKGWHLWRHRSEPGQGLEQVDGMGAGCWLMTREVAEALGERPYDMSGGTEDLKLSLKLKELGIPLFVDWTMECAHIGVSWV